MSKRLKFAAQFVVVAMLDICIVFAIGMGIKSLLNKHVDETVTDEVIEDVSKNAKVCSCCNI